MGHNRVTRITVYHKPDCVQCEATMRALVERGLSYEAVDLTQDAEAFARATAAGHRQAPIIAVDGQIAWAGFRPDLIDQIAEEAGL